MICLLILGLHLLQSSIINGELTLKVMCDDVTTIFIDGEEQSAAGTGAWNQLATLSLPENVGAIGIKCQNGGGPYGIMAQLEDSSGEVFEVTDDSWQCSNSPAEDWATASFSGDWSPAAYYEHRNYINDEGAWAGMSPNRKIIWTSSSSDMTVYCRKSFARNTLSVMCDDIANVYVDGEEMESPGNAAWNQMSTFSISTRASVIGVKCRNTGGPYGIMVEMRDPQNEVIMISDDTWTCSNAANDGWSTADFEENWATASYANQGPYSTACTGAWQNMSPVRRIIWTGSGGDTTAYCRKVLQRSRMLMGAQCDRA